MISTPFFVKKKNVGALWTFCEGVKLALQYCPQSPMVDVAVGEALMEGKPSGYLPKAKHLFERALRLDPRNISAQEGLRDVQQRQASQAQTQKMMSNIIGAFFR